MAVLPNLPIQLYPNLTFILLLNFIVKPQHFIHLKSRKLIPQPHTWKVLFGDEGGTLGTILMFLVVVVVVVVRVVVVTEVVGPLRGGSSLERAEGFTLACLRTRPPANPLCWGCESPSIAEGPLNYFISKNNHSKLASGDYCASTFYTLLINV